MEKLEPAVAQQIAQAVGRRGRIHGLLAIRQPGSTIFQEN
jgi:hypothetical protein